MGMRIYKFICYGLIASIAAGEVCVSELYVRHDKFLKKKISDSARQQLLASTTAA